MFIGRVDSRNVYLRPWTPITRSICIHTRESWRVQSKSILLSWLFLFFGGGKSGSFTSVQYKPTESCTLKPCLPILDLPEKVCPEYHRTQKMFVWDSATPSFGNECYYTFWSNSNPEFHCVLMFVRRECLSSSGFGRSQKTSKQSITTTHFCKINVFWSLKA